jgi:endonuclease/exonuclease/phosphatase (EEP) superfamily protein YafD
MQAKDVIDIAVANVEFGRASPRKLRETLPARLPDILVIAEATSDWINQAAWASEYRFKIEAPGKSAEGMAVFSRYPLEGSTDITPDFFKTLSVSVRLAEDRTLRLIALHAPPPHVDLSFEFRHAYFTLLDRHISSLPGSEPLLLAGDFNTTPASDSYRTLVAQHELKNCAQGRGFPSTWPLKILPWVGAYIDQFLYRGAIDVVDLRVLDDFGSDHRPLFVTFAMN